MEKPTAYIIFSGGRLKAFSLKSSIKQRSILATLFNIGLRVQKERRRGEREEERKEGRASRLERKKYNYLFLHMTRPNIQKILRNPQNLLDLINESTQDCQKQDQYTKLNCRASLVAQWLRICLPIQGTRVRALVWEDPTCRGATRPVSHNY